MAFPPASQPGLIRAAQKDDLYLQHLTDACHDAVRRMLGPHRALRWAGETRALAELLYLSLTTGAGRQTPGEEYCDILQVAGTAGAPPGPARRGLLVLLQALGPYAADRLTAQQDDGYAAWQQARVQAAHAQAAAAGPQQQQQQPGSLGVQLLHRLAVATRRLQRATQEAAQPVTRRLPAVAAFVQQHGATLLRIHLALFYVWGLYYQPGKRLAGVRYLFLGRAFEGRPSYRFLGVLLFGQLGLSGLLWLLRRRGSLQHALTSSRQGQARQQAHAVLLAADGTPLLDRSGEAGPGQQAAAVEAGSVAPAPSRQCPLCLSARTHPTATPCGHVFCWQCITDWGNQKPECPLCRADFTPSSLVCVRHADY